MDVHSGSIQPSLLLMVDGAVVALLANEFMQETAAHARVLRQRKSRTDAEW